MQLVRTLWAESLRDVGPWRRKVIEARTAPRLIDDLGHERERPDEWDAAHIDGAPLHRHELVDDPLLTRGELLRQRREALPRCLARRRAGAHLPVGTEWHHQDIPVRGRRRCRTPRLCRVVIGKQSDDEVGINREHGVS